MALALASSFPEGHCCIVNPSHYHRMVDALAQALVAQTTLSAATLLKLAGEASRLMRSDETGKLVRPPPSPLEDVFVWVALHMMDLDEAAWQVFIDYAQDRLSPNVLDAFSSMFELVRRNNKVTGTASGQVVVVMYQGVGGSRIRMALAKQADNLTTYTVGDHTATATVAPHLQQEMDFVRKNGMAPYHPTSVVLYGKKTFYYSRCQWGNCEMDWLTPYQRDHRVYMQLHGQDPDHGYNSGWYVDSDAWENEPVAGRTRSSKRRRL